MAIHIPSGGISTKDATLQPAEALNGRIFYNADGRQTGLGFFKQEKSVIAANNGSYEIATNYGIKANYVAETGVIWTNGGQFTGFSDERVPLGTQAKCKLSLPIDTPILITGWKINGQKTNLYPPIGNMFDDGSSTSGVTIGYDHNPTKFYIYWVDANYSGGARKGWYIDDVLDYSVEIFYIEME